MELVLKRKYKKPAYTLGRLYHDTRYLCDTLEPPVRGNPRAIPSARYPIIINWSNKFGRWLPLLVGVKGYSGIRIHAGNKPSDTRGCILPGHNRRRGHVLQSTTCVNTIMRLLEDSYGKGEAAWITIRG